MESRVDRIMAHIRGHYSSDEIVVLVSTVLEWESPQELKYYDDEAIADLLLDLVLSREADMDIMLSKSIDEMPLYVNHGAKISQLMAKWRMSCGH